MNYTALVVEDDPQSLDLIEDVLVVLDHKHDVAATLLEARRLVRANEYSYILLDIEFPARSPRGIPRIQNAESFLEDLAEGQGEDAPPVIIMNDRAAGDLDLTEDMMRLAMSLCRKGAIDLIKKPFPTAGRTLDRVIKKALGSNGKRKSRAAVSARAGAPTPVGKTTGRARTAAADPLTLTRPEHDILQALGESPHETMLQVDVIAAAGYSKHVTAQALRRLRKVGFVRRPHGPRKGDTLTVEGRAFFDVEHADKKK
ncbi:MAG: DNA-binding response regulator [Phycisphaerales bacterium]|jgi:DNA-binding response OmpR family regulator|nr:DNA-binding response regulator [Phycisphaerales bacterium]